MTRDGDLEVGGFARPAALGVAGLAKTFGRTRALDGVSFSVQPGTIHCLLGGNGSGKSTTIKILSGMYDAHDGAIEIGGERHPAASWSAAKAKAAGLRFVHQQPSTFPTMTVAENIALGHGFESRAGRVRWRAQQRRARELLTRFGLDIDPRAELARYGVATHAMVAIARALQDVEITQEGHCAGILVLDEPTAALPPKEVGLLLSELRRFAADGQTIIYVTHRLEEVVQIADRATILRDGRVAGTLSKSEIDHPALVSMITGGNGPATVSDARARQGGRARLHCEGVAGGAVREASFEVCAGEIVGVAGLLGSGRSTLLRLLAGDVGRECGTVRLDDEPVNFTAPRQSIRAGVAYVPEDRRTSAAFMEMSVRENVAIAATGRHFRKGRLQHRAEARDVQGLLSAYRVRAASTETPIGTLSGGNQQKALIARWLRLDPRLLLLDEPTQGVDIGARAEIWQLVRRVVNQGAASLAVLSDFEELLSVCDRVIVVTGGRTVAEYVCDGMSEAALESAVMGVEVRCVE
jgi:ribose transport system ATP-binding protein